MITVNEGDEALGLGTLFGYELLQRLVLLSFTDIRRKQKLHTGVRVFWFSRTKKEAGRLFELLQYLPGSQQPRLCLLLTTSPTPHPVGQAKWPRWCGW